MGRNAGFQSEEGGQLAANQLAHGSVIVINTAASDRPFLTNVGCL